jgi:hypothetical protein
MNPSDALATASGARRLYLWPAVLGVAATAWVAPQALLVLLLDGLTPAAVVSASAGWGAWPARALRRAGAEGAARQFCLATALGLGLLAWITLAAGLAGVLTQGVAWGILIVGGALGITRLMASRRGRSSALPGAPTSDQVRQRRLSWESLALIPLALPLVVVLVGTSLPPGLIWPEEANGYDVLEYHLQAPREYFENGRIAFLPHNVYSAFPQQVETLYLLLMHLRGGAHAAAVPSQLLHAALGVLAVLAVAAWSAPGRARTLAVLLVGGLPWLAYLGCLAYVENAMLFFVAVAVGMTLESLRDARVCAARGASAVGWCAGLAAGCKYTAVGLVVVPIAVAWLLTTTARTRTRLGRVANYAVCAAAAFAPWALRNAALTGNPVYPFAYSVLDGADWSAEQAEQWTRGHRLPPEDAGIVGRAIVGIREILGLDLGERGALPALRASLFGAPLIPLAIFAAVRLRRERTAAFCMLLAGLMLLVWAAATHMPGRFVVPLAIPLAYLGAALARARENDGEHPRGRSGPLAAALIALTGIGTVWNGAWLVTQLASHAQHWQRHTNVPLTWMIGRTDIQVEVNPVNAATPPDANVWIVGDAAVFYVARRMHYTVVFSRDPWLDAQPQAAVSPGPAEAPMPAIERQAEAAVAWLRRRGVTHVVFHWPEIQRLRAPSGFDGRVQREWVRGLRGAGLRLREARGEGPDGPQIEVYEVLPGSDEPDFEASPA